MSRHGPAAEVRFDFMLVYDALVDKQKSLFFTHADKVVQCHETLRLYFGPLQAENLGIWESKPLWK